MFPWQGLLLSSRGATPEAQVQVVWRAASQRNAKMRRRPQGDNAVMCKVNLAATHRSKGPVKLLPLRVLVDRVRILAAACWHLLEEGALASVPQAELHLKLTLLLQAPSRHLRQQMTRKLQRNGACLLMAEREVQREGEELFQK